jgi:tetratricopeptide (TPR) repeat protein
MEALKDLYQRAAEAFDHQQYGQAIELYQQIVKVAPNFAPAYNGLAMANQASSGDEDQTIAYLKTAISYDPKMTQAYDNLGRIYFAREDMQNSEQYFEGALKLDPNLASANLSLAWINLLGRSKPGLALKYFERIAPTSSDPKVFFGMGQAYFATNQRDKAMDMITKLHEMGQEELASRLEQSLRDHEEVDATPIEESETTNTTPAAQPAGFGPLEPTSDKPTGMQVRLRGKLSDY